jgi:hypothetical protein
MTTATMQTSRSTPWHFWVVAAIAVLWNGFGGYDYTMSQLQGDAYFRAAGMTEAQITYINGMPGWMTAVWAVGVWGAVAGSLLLLLRRRWAVHAFAVSLAGLVVSLIYTYGLSDGASVMGQQVMIMNLVVLAGCVFFLWYAARMAKRGLLR